MAKQSKTARADSSAGKSAAAVSNDTDAVAAAEPAQAPEVSEATAETAADSAVLLSVAKSMYEDLPGIIASLEAEVRASAQDMDHARHALYSRLATVFGEFRAGLASVLNAPQV
jgi:hypothetical protein